MVPILSRRRGSPIKQVDNYGPKREALLRGGIAILTEKNYSSVSMANALVMR